LYALRDYYVTELNVKITQYYKTKLNYNLSPIED
jgi:hypothetical protein